MFTNSKNMNQRNAMAMVFDSTSKTFNSKEVEFNELDEEETLIKIEYTTICSSDLHTYCGRRPLDSSTILGHEIAGRIVQLPKNTRTDYTGKELNIGDLVTWCVYAYKDDDPIAQKGFPQKSTSLYKYGHHPFNNSELNGGFATHCILKKGTAIFKLSTQLSLKEVAPLNCTHATIAGGLRLAGNIENKSILIYGAGMLGLSAAAMASKLKATQIIICDINTNRLAIAKEFGAQTTLDNTLSTIEKQRSLAELNIEIDVIIDTTGIPSVMEEGIDLLSIGGISIWIGAVFNQSPTSINAEKVVRKLLTIKGLHNYIPQDLQTAIQFLEENHHSFPFKELISDEYLLEELENAFQSATSGKHFRVGVIPAH